MCVSFVLNIVSCEQCRSRFLEVRKKWKWLNLVKFDSYVLVFVSAVAKFLSTFLLVLSMWKTYSGLSASFSDVWGLALALSSFGVSSIHRVFAWSYWFIENRLARFAMNRLRAWFSPIVVKCFSWSAVVILWRRDWPCSLSSWLLFKGRANGSVKW